MIDLAILSRLNAPTAEEYEALCRPLIKNAFEEVLAFARRAKETGLNAWFSVVDVIGEEKVEKCRELANRVGIPLRVRKMIN